MTAYLPRLVDSTLEFRLAELPAVMILGPRGCGKTTTASRHARTIVQLDDPDRALAFRASPDAALAQCEPPVLLDEWQEAPEVLGAVKRAVDRERGPGRFLITGSVRARRTATTWPATGRVVPLEMTGMCVAEQLGQPTTAPLTSLLRPEHARTPADPPDLLGYLDLVVTSGFPEAMGLTPRARTAWLRGYADQLIHRDVRSLVAGHLDPMRLASSLEAVAASLAGTPAETTLAGVGGLDVRTVRAHLDLLTDLRIIERVPAWHSNRLSRLTKAPKYYVCDPGLAAILLDLDRAAIMASGDLLGRFIDAFVMAQLRALTLASETRWTRHHLRDRGGQHEVDIVLERPGGTIVGLEIKAAGGASRRDARHLEWLRDEVPDQFAAGVVLHTGPDAYPLADKVWALPIATLWEG